MLGFKRISKMMLLTEPTSLQAARTASVARESPVSLQTFVKYEWPKFCMYEPSTK